MSTETRAGDNALETAAQGDWMERLSWGLIEGTASLYRWTLGALVTLNGGAIVAILSANVELEHASRKQALMYFFLGCDAAILAALTGTGATLVLAMMLRDRTLLRFMKGWKRKAFTFGASLCLSLNVVSLMMFIGGGIAVAVAMDGAAATARTAKVNTPK